MNKKAVLIFSIMIVSFHCGNYLFSQGNKSNIPEILLLEKSEKITGPMGIGYSGSISTEWQLYQKIKEKYPSEMLNAEYYKTDSIITKIYLYLILWENIWQEITEIESDIEQYSNESILFFGGGCVGYNENVGLIIEAIKDDISFLRLPEEEKQKYWDKLERQMSDNPDVFEIYPARKNSLFR